MTKSQMKTAHYLITPDQLGHIRNALADYKWALERADKYYRMNGVPDDRTSNALNLVNKILSEVNTGTLPFLEPVDF